MRAVVKPEKMLDQKAAEKNKNRVSSHPEDDFGFLLWKSELNKELLSFWKLLAEHYQK